MWAAFATLGLSALALPPVVRYLRSASRPPSAFPVRHAWTVELTRERGDLGTRETVRISQEAGATPVTEVLDGLPQLTRREITQ